MEAVRESLELGELMRSDAESISIDRDGIMEVVFDEGRAQSKGLIVPIAIEGRGGGNVFQEYIALYRLIRPDEEWLQGLGNASNDHRSVALLAYSQIDMHRVKVLEWLDRRLIPGKLVVRACTTELDVKTCPKGASEQIIVAFSDALFGPNLRIFYGSDPLQ